MMEKEKLRISNYKEKDNKIYLDATVKEVGETRDLKTFKAHNVQLVDDEGTEFELQCYDGNIILTQEDEGKRVLLKNLYWSKTYEGKPILTTGRYMAQYGEKIKRLES